MHRLTEKSGRWGGWLGVCVALAALGGCMEPETEDDEVVVVVDGPDTGSPADPDAGARDTATSDTGPADTGSPPDGWYTGDNPHVQTAQRKFRTPLELHGKVIQRTCSPTGGVCHNRSEYPDLHTPANLLATVGAPCNVQTDNWKAVYDRCERPGDRFMFQQRPAPEVEIGYVEHVAGEHIDYVMENVTPDADSPGLHIYLHDRLDIEHEVFWDVGQFIRTFVDDNGDVRDLAYARFHTRWWLLDDGKHLMAEVRDDQTDTVTELMSVGVEQGDLNRNGVYGARQSEPAALLEPGKPEQSYLIARLRGKMQGEPVPGTRMPLANQPLSIPEMLALYCFVEGLPADAGDANHGPNGVMLDESTPIDYRNCSYAENPEQLNLLGEGVTWSGRVSKILEANCGGCHGGTDPDAGFDVLGAGASDAVLATSTQKPGMKRVEPGKPAESYLWWKLQARHDATYRDKIVGQPMPINPVDGESTLSEAERRDIKTWIENGALDE